MAVSKPDETLHDEDEKAEENHKNKEHDAAHDSNLYVTQIAEEMLDFREEDFKVSRKIYF